MSKYSEIKVPVDLCSFALKKHKCKELRLLILLKLQCDGTMKLNEDEYLSVRDSYFGCKRSFKRHLKSLIELKWVWVNHNRGILHLNSFDKILVATKNKSRRRVAVNIEFLKESRSISALCISAVIGSLINQNKKGVQRMKAEQTSGGSIIPSRAPFSYFGYGVKRIAKIVGRSTGNVHNLKIIAEEFGFMTCKKIKVPLKIQGNSIHANQLGIVKKAHVDLANRIWPYKGFTFIWYNDEIIPHLQFSSQRVNYKRIHTQFFSKAS